jgi:protein-S-isoprenylcysteine O-methyltransferase Ste14
VEYRASTPLYAFVLAVVSGTLFATGHYLGGGITALIAVVLFALWQFANERGDDDRHTIW